VVVSHDRYLVERVCDTTVALLGDGTLAALPGGIEEYLERRRHIVEPTAPEARERKGDPRATRKELTRIERSIANFDKREKVLLAQLAEHATDYAKVADLDGQLREVVTAREAAEHEWLELAEDD
jgi:ATP-binding cassette subfamily F protein uup